MKYQVQEMLRVERIFDPQEIEHEIEAYNPLIPDGSNWKATFMIEYPEVAQRQAALARMPGIEHKVWVQVAGHDRVFAGQKKHEGKEIPNTTGRRAGERARFACPPHVGCIFTYFELFI